MKFHEHMENNYTYILLMKYYFKEVKSTLKTLIFFLFITI